MDNFFSAKNLVDKAKRHIEEISNKEGLSGIPTGFYDLDKLISGWQPSDLIVIAGQTGMGKTSLILSMIRNMGVDFQIPVGLFSLEMSSYQIISRFICQETKLSIDKLRKGALEKHEWEMLSINTKKLENAPIYIDDVVSLSIYKLKERIENLIINYGVKIVFIDTINLVNVEENLKKSNLTREQELSIIVRELKSYSKEFSIPIIAISQLSREIEKRGGNYIPKLSDLRGSGTIEEVADIVSFIYRPEYYKIEEWDDEECSSTQGQAELIIAKNRNGGLDRVRLKFIQSLGQFGNLDDDFTNFSDKFPIRMNPFIDESFGSNNSADDDDSDVPF